MKKNISLNGRKHGMRAKLATADRQPTTIAFERASQAYRWSTDRGRQKLVIKH